MTVTHGEKRQASAGPRHGDVVEAPLGVFVLAVRWPVPAAVENDHVVEFEPLRAVRRQEQQAGLAFSGVAAPLGEPLDHVPAVRLAVAEFTVQVLETLSEQRPPMAKRLQLHPIGDVDDPDSGVGTPPEPVGQILRFAQPPNVRRMVGCRNSPRRAITPNGLKLAPGPGDDRCLGPRPSSCPGLEALQLAHRQNRLDGLVLGHAQNLYAPPPELVEPR